MVKGNGGGIMRITPKTLEREIKDHWLSRKDAAALLGKSGERVHQMANEGKITVIDTPNGKLYSRDDVERLSGKEGH